MTGYRGNPTTGNQLGLCFSVAGSHCHSFSHLTGVIRMIPEKPDENYTDEQFWADMKAYLDTLPSGIEIEETIIIIEDKEIDNEC